MKKKDLQTIRLKDIKTLAADVSKKKKELVKEEMNLRAGKLTKFKNLRSLRYEIAQLLTILRSKELEEKKG